METTDKIALKATDKGIHYKININRLVESGEQDTFLSESTLALQAHLNSKFRIQSKRVGNERGREREGEGEREKGREYRKMKAQRL